MILPAIDYPRYMATVAVASLNAGSLPVIEDYWIQTKVTQFLGYDLDMWSILGINPGASTFLQLEAQLNVLEDLYQIIDQEQVNSFLTKNQGIIRVLFDAQQQIRKYFINEPLRLKVEKDPEYEKEELVIYIETERQVDDVYARLEQLDQNWWLAELGNTNGLLSIAPSFL